MGTNYYLKGGKCPHCGRFDTELHIGKSSGGWCFSLHVYPDEGINTLEDWKRQFEKPDQVILNEYGDEIPAVAMLEEITNRENKKGRQWTDGELYRNHAVRGPRGLVRHQIDGFCIGHGEGTWDYIVGEFS